MKVAVFSLAYFPFIGGAEVAVKEISGRIPVRDFFVFTNKFNRSWPSRERLGNCEIFRLGRGSNSNNYYGRFLEKILYVFRAWRKAEKLHKDRPFELIWAVMAAYGGIAALLFKLRHPSVPLILTLQEGDSEGHILKRVGIFYPFWRLIFRKADYIQVISNYLAEFARRHGAKCPVEVVPNGVNLTRIRNNELRIKNESKNEKVIITTSRLVYKNGIDILIRAAAQLKPIIPACRQARHNSQFIIQILGSGPEERKLKRLAKDLGVENKIEFLGHVDPEKIPAHLARADVFVRPSRSEGLGNSFLEAMAAGLPVIGTKVGGIPDFLKEYNTNLRMGTNATNGENGLFTEVDNPKDLAGKIAFLINNDELCKKLGENGRKLVIGQYSWDNISKKMETIFNKSLEIRNLKLGINRLLIATGIYPPDIGGPATYTVLMERELPKRGFAVGVLPFTKFRTKPKIFRHLLYLWNCWKMSGNFDFVYAQDPVSVGLPALIAARMRGKKFFIRVAGDYAWEQSVQRFGVKDTIDNFQKRKYGWRVELLRKIQRLVVGKADLVITPSKYFQKLVGGWVKNPEKVHVIYNGVELGNWKLARQLADGNWKFLPKTILSAGRLVPWKGFDVLIEIMKDLPDWKLVIVGDGPEYRNLKFKIENLKLTDCVNLVGSVPREKLQEYLQTSAVFVLNTSFESFSFQVVEAMAAGVPVIATNIGNLAEIVENGKEGILIEPNNKEQILTAVKKISDNDEFREMIVKNAKEKSQRFSIDRTVDSLVSLIGRV